MLRNRQEFWYLPGIFTEYGDLSDSGYIFLKLESAMDFLGEMGHRYLEHNPGKDLPTISYFRPYSEIYECWKNVNGCFRIKWVNAALVRKK